jgi:hypothetical protein
MSLRERTRPGLRDDRAVRLLSLTIRVGALNLVKAECGRKNVNTKSILIDLLLRLWRYRFRSSRPSASFAHTFQTEMARPSG